MKNIETVMMQRFNYQSTVRALETELGVTVPSFAYFKHSNFINLFKSWPTNKQDKFIQIIGGKSYYKKTKQYFQNLIKQ